jgi:UDPglucose--hexose-1-phosphate uridylyltransferase
MAKYVPDVNTQRWVIIAPARTSRPDDAGKPAVSGCPFCPGNEAATPPELYRLGPGEKDMPGWQVRVVPNKYRITDTHEVIIQSPSHTEDVDTLPLTQVTQVFSVYRDRSRAHERDGQVIVFCNHGAHAGASLTHPHSQLVVVPKQINLDSLSREPINNTVENNSFYLTYCPDFSQWPYEVWIAPKEEGKRFSDVTDKELPDLANVMQTTLKRIKAVYEKSPIKPKDRQDSQFVFNYYISHGPNWFIRIIPRFIHRAGFELGTGLNVNVVDPTDAARELSAVKI